MATTTNYAFPYPISSNVPDIAGDIQDLAQSIDTNLQEIIEDAAAAVITGGTFNNGLSTPTYNDTTGKITMTLSQDLRSTASPSFVGLTLTGTAGVGSLSVTNNSTLTGDLAVNGGDITTTATTFNLLNTTATTMNFAGAATTLNIGNASGTNTILGNTVLSKTVVASQTPDGALPSGTPVRATRNSVASTSSPSAGVNDTGTTNGDVWYVYIA